MRRYTRGVFELGLVSLILVSFLTVASEPITGNVIGEKTVIPVRGDEEDLGSVFEFDLGSSELENLTEEQGVELSLKEDRVTEDFDDTSGFGFSKNIVLDDRNFEIDHDFKKTYGGIDYDSILRTIRTSDGGYASVGTSASFSKYPGPYLWVMKFNNRGEMLWNRTYGGSSNDEGSGIFEASNGDLLLTGNTVSFGSRNIDPWLIRTDSKGREIWNHTYPMGEPSYGTSVIERSSGDIAFCGYRFNQSGTLTDDAFIIVTDSEGNERFNRTWGTSGDEVARDLIETADGKLTVIGDSEPFNGIEMITIWKLDDSGDELYNKTFGGRSWYMGYRIAEHFSGDMFLFGLVMTMPGVGLDYVLIRLGGMNGTMKWMKNYDSGGNDNPHGMTLDNEGVTMTGRSSGFSSGFEDAYMVRTDLNGVQLWSRHYGGGGGNAVATDVLESPFGKYAFGYSYGWGPGFCGGFILNLTTIGEGNPGTFRSRNLLQDLEVESVEEMVYTCGFGTDGLVEMRFSSDGIIWKDSLGSVDQYNPLSSGSGRIQLDELDGISDSFFIEIKFSCSSGQPGSFSSMALVYSSRASQGHLISDPFEVEEGVDWGKIGIDIDLPEGTSATVQLRSTTTLEWDLDSDFTGPDGSTSTFYSDGDHLWSGVGEDNVVQLMVNLTTSDKTITPVINGLNVSYDIPGMILATNLTYAAGDIDDIFNFTLTFSDRDGDLPGDVMIFLDESGHPMEEVDEMDIDTIDGKVYYYLGKLDMGNHTYSFEVDYGGEILTTYDFLFKVLPGPLTSIGIVEDGISITADENYQFTAMGYDRAGNLVDVEPTWEVSGGGTIEDGLFTAEKVGTWEVTASIDDITGMVNITVTPGELASVKVVTDVYEITADESVQLNAVGFDSDLNQIEIDPMWEAEGGGIVDQNGLFQGDVVGFWKIYANISGLSAYEIIGVEPGNLTNIIVEPDSFMIDVFDTAQFFATGFDSDGNWVSFNPSWSAEAGSILSTGFYTADTPGTWKVFCEDQGITGETVISVNGTSPAEDDDDVNTGDDDDEEKDKGGISPVLIGSITGILVILLVIAVVIAVFIKRKASYETEPVVDENNSEAEDLYGQLGIEHDTAPSQEQAPLLQQEAGSQLDGIDMKLPQDYNTSSEEMEEQGQ